ncbi:MAG: single-stranded DNA-binding protein [Planctomycetota bacterium]|nr:MAG: single-stranded DNA-binding protein [Planctomycetota bacterium]
MPEARSRAPRSSAARGGGSSPLDAAHRLAEAVAPYPARAPLGKAAFVLDPLDYAWPYHREYIERFAPREPGAVEAILVGMNPGPWGMAQTGVPFGSPDVVESFLGIRGPVSPPARTHPKRPVRGWEGGRGEVSGRRLWGGIRACFGTPEAFFARFYVANYCPLVFQSESGANITPDKLPRTLVGPLLDACAEHMAALVSFARPRAVIGVGKWAEKQLAKLVEERSLDVGVGGVLHPSPASPLANRGWLERARAQLAALGHPWPEPVH